MPVEWNEPFKALDCSGLPADVAQSLLAAPTDMAIALGLALVGSSRGAPVRLSLLPAGQKQGKAQRRRAILTVAAGLLYVLGLAALATAALRDKGNASEELKQAKDLLKRYEDRIAAFDEVVKVQGRRKIQAQLLHNEVVIGRSVLETLARLQRLLPDGMTVSSIALDRRAPSEGAKGCELKIHGTADEGSLKNPYELLRKIAAELGDPGRGILAEASQYKQSARAGLGEFEFTVTIPQFVPQPEKAEGDEAAPADDASQNPQDAKPGAEATK
jgi:hypothetical protein